MKINGLNAYKEQIISDRTELQSSQTLDIRAKYSIDSEKLLNPDSTLRDTDNLITRKERNYFIRLFPENSEQIQKHILFNRSGKLQTQNIAKGTIVDGRV